MRISGILFKMMLSALVLFSAGISLAHPLDRFVAGISRALSGEGRAVTLAAELRWRMRLEESGEGMRYFPLLRRGGGPAASVLRFSLFVRANGAEFSLALIPQSVVRRAPRAVPITPAEVEALYTRVLPQSQDLASTWARELGLSENIVRVQAGAADDGILLLFDPNLVPMSQVAPLIERLSLQLDEAFTL